MINIRDYSEGDLERIIEIEDESFSDPYDRRLFLYLLQENRLLVAEEDGRVEGYIIYGTPGDRGVIVSLAVSIEHRRRGIGGMLLERAITDLRGLERIDLQVSIKDEDTIAFYVRRGFSPSRTLRGYYGRGMDALLMILQPPREAPPKVRL